MQRLLSIYAFLYMYVELAFPMYKGEKVYKLGLTICERSKGAFTNENNKTI